MTLNGTTFISLYVPRTKITSKLVNHQLYILTIYILKTTKKFLREISTIHTLSPSKWIFLLENACFISLYLHQTPHFISAKLLASSLLNSSLHLCQTHCSSLLNSLLCLCKTLCLISSKLLGNSLHTSPTPRNSSLCLCETPCFISAKLLASSPPNSSLHPAKLLTLSPSNSSLLLHQTPWFISAKLQTSW